MPQNDRDAGSPHSDPSQDLLQLQPLEGDGAPPTRIDLSHTEVVRTKPAACGGQGSLPADPARNLLTRRHGKLREERTAPTVASIADACWRPLALGIAAGCLVGVMSLGLGPKRKPPLSAQATTISEMPGSVAATTDGISGTMSVAEIALDDIIIHAAAPSWRPDVAAAARVELEMHDVSVSGRAVAAVILLKRTGSIKGRARVVCRTVPGTATPTKDYESVSTVVQFGDKQAMRTIFVPILQKPPQGELRTFSVTLERAPRGPALGAVTSTNVTIRGDG